MMRTTVLNPKQIFHPLSFLPCVSSFSNSWKILEGQICRRGRSSAKDHFMKWTANMCWPNFKEFVALFTIFYFYLLKAPVSRFYIPIFDLVSNNQGPTLTPNSKFSSQKRNISQWISCKASLFLRF